MEAWKTAFNDLEKQIHTLQNELASFRGEVVQNDHEIDTFQIEAVKMKQEQKTALDTIDSQISKLKSEIVTLQQSIAQNDAEIDTLQIESAKVQRPWYRDISTMIALLALLFSFGTTAASYYTTAQQDVHDNRAELRVFLQRLIALPKESAEIQNQPNKFLAGQLYGLITGETTLIANQAVEVIERIPNHVSAVEYNLVATTLMNNGDFAQAEKLLQRAIAVSGNVSDEVTSLRAYGTLLFVTGNFESGREMYRRALNIFQKYPSKIPTYVDWTNAFTEMNWAGTELAQKQCTEAQSHLQNAFALATRLQPGPSTDNLVQQLTEAQQILDKSCK